MWQYLSNRPFVKIPIYINVIRDPNNRNHFLRTDHRAILDSLDASQQNKFGSVRYSVTNTTFPNSMLNDNFDFSRDYINQFGRLIPYDFVNQVIPLIFKITGEEW